MAKKEDRISINALEKVAKENFTPVVTKEWFGLEVSIRRTLPLAEVLMFTEDIVNNCFTPNGTFIPQVMDFAIKEGILTRYANFTMPSNAEKQYELVYATDAVDMVMEEIDNEQLKAIIDAADRKIDYLCDANIKETREQLCKLFATFDKLAKIAGTTFDGMKPEDMQKFISAFNASDAEKEYVASEYIQKRDAEQGAGEDVPANEAEAATDDK